MVGVTPDQPSDGGLRGAVSSRVTGIVPARAPPSGRDRSGAATGSARLGPASRRGYREGITEPKRPSSGVTLHNQQHRAERQLDPRAEQRGDMGRSREDDRKDRGRPD